VSIGGHNGNDDTLRAFRELIGPQRKAAGLTQRQLAQAARVSIGVVRDLEQGLTARPRRDSVQRLAAALGIVLRPNGAEYTNRASFTSYLTVGSADPGGALQISILGAISAWRGGVSLPLGPARRRAILGLLAASPQEIVSRGQLTDALWGDSPPEHAATMIQSQVSALRRVLDPRHPAQARNGLIVSAGSGYQLNTARCSLDVTSFQRLGAEARAALRGGRPAAACAAWADALALWRGDPLSDVDSLSGHQVVLSLARQRGRAIVEYAEAAERLERCEGPLHLLEGLCEREPLNERAHAGLMIALAGTGQHAAALNAFERVRRRLRDDLGLLPDPELAAAHVRVLRQQIGPAGTQPRPSRRR
jgi:DNA-binding SARP family transcriptional activator